MTVRALFVIGEYPALVIERTLPEARSVYRLRAYVEQPAVRLDDISLATTEATIPEFAIDFELTAYDPYRRMALYERRKK